MEPPESECEVVGMLLDLALNLDHLTEDITSYTSTVLLTYFTLVTALTRTSVDAVILLIF